MSWKLNWVAPTTVVGRDEPFTCTTEPGIKLDPMTVTGVGVAAPAATVLGASETMLGFGFDTSKEIPKDAPPPGRRVHHIYLETSRGSLISNGELEAQLGRADDCGGRDEPFTCTTEPGIKLDPMTVTGVGVAAPAATVLGASETMLGFGFDTSKEIPKDAPPPGEGFTTFTWRLPAAA